MYIQYYWYARSLLSIIIILLVLLLLRIIRRCEYEYVQVSIRTMNNSSDTYYMHEEVWFPADSIGLPPYNTL